VEVRHAVRAPPTFYGDTIYGETRVLAEWASKDDRGIVHVETAGYEQDGTVVCVFRRKVMVPEGQLPAGARP
jgi:acyl dehydratase